MPTIESALDPRSPEARANAETARKLWDLSEQLTGVAFPALSPVAA